MKILIHKGSREIGGTCIELKCKGRSILLDAGTPLEEKSRPPDLSGVKAEALLVSHPHQDHYGLMEALPPEVPVYVGEVGRKLIEAPLLFRGMSLPSRNCRNLAHRRRFEVGGFSVTPFLVDHSSPEAFAFLVEAGGKRIFYSGDFRGHGKKGKLFDSMVKHPPGKIDALILEGTNLGRKQGEFATEEEIGDKIREIIREQKNVSFLICSGQNVDRLTVAWKACRDEKKIMVIDLYTAWVLEKMRLVTDGVPAMHWQGMRVLFTKGQRQTVENHPDYFGEFLARAHKRRIYGRAIHRDPAKHLCVARTSMADVIETYRGEHPVNVIYSQWKGYLAKSRWKAYGAEKMASYQNDPDMIFHYIHTSGHADLPSLQAFAKAINARKVLPVHTERAGDFAKYFANVVPMTDGRELTI